MTALRDIKVPYILVCQLTGLNKSYTSKEFVQRKIDNYGGDENAMLKGFVCKDAKRAIKDLGDISKVTESDMEKMIKKLGGTLDAKTALERLQGGKLFLTKKVKVRAKGAGSKKRAAKKTTKSGAASTKKPRPSRSKAAIAARKAAKEAQGSKTSAQGEKSEGAASPKAHAQGEKHGQGSKTEAPAGGQG